MKRETVFKVSAAIVTVCMLGLTLVLAHGHGSRHCKGMTASNATMVTVRGTVADVKEQACKMATTCTHLKVSQDGKSFDVHLSSSSFLMRHRVFFSSGDEIEVQGFRAECCGANILHARTVAKGGTLLALSGSCCAPQRGSCCSAKGDPCCRSSKN